MMKYIIIVVNHLIYWMPNHLIALIKIIPFT